MTSKETAIKALSAIFVDFDVAAAEKLLAPDYIQHNPNVPTGAAPILGFIPSLEESGITPKVHRVIADEQFVVVHVTYDNAQLFGSPSLVAFDVFRVAGGRVVEHWDNLQEPATETASGRSMTDGVTEIVDLEKTADNKRLVEAFVADVLVGGKFDKAPEYIIADPGAYRQHNPGVADGLDKLGKAFAKLAQDGKAIAYSKIHKVIAEGNFVFVMAEGTFGDARAAYFDLFRLEDEKIVEHWDTISPIPRESEMAHSNGKF
jgi:predicted SnoaL-like aldol condensation-catalyzing enzyme